jgi:predicted ribosome quality control (RQC) complex YloA/Tae2 family protein
VGRDARDNAALKEMRQDADILLHTVDMPGPTVLLPCGASDDDITLAASVCATYGDRGTRQEAVVRIHTPAGANEKSVPALPRGRLNEMML